MIRIALRLVVAKAAEQVQLALKEAGCLLEVAKAGKRSWIHLGGYHVSVRLDSSCQIGIAHATQCPAAIQNVLLPQVPNQVAAPSPLLIILMRIRLFQNSVPREAAVCMLRGSSGPDVR